MEGSDTQPSLCLTLRPPPSPLSVQLMSSLLAGAALGSINGDVLSDALGRRRGLLLAAPPLLLGSVLCALARSLASLLAGRFIVGVSVGMMSVMVPM